MACKFHLTERAILELSRIDHREVRRILDKIKFYCNSENPLVWAKPLKGNIVGSYRFRVGDYRIFFDIKRNMIFALKIEHRKDVYRK